MASSYGTDASKASLRDGYLRLCEDMPKDFSARVDEQVRAMFLRLDWYAQTDLLLGYLPVHEEIDTLPLLEAAFASHKRVALPYLDGTSSTLEFYEISSLDEIARGSRGLARPPREDAKPLGTAEDLVVDDRGYIYLNALHDGVYILKCLV